MGENLKLDPQPEPPLWIRRTIESEIRYMQEGLEIIKTVGLEKPGPTPWKLIDLIGKPGPIPWKLIDTVASYVPGNNLEKIVAMGIKSEIAYIQEGIAIRKTLYDTLNKPSPDPWIRRTIESEMRYMQEGLEIIKTVGLEKPGPTPWKLIDLIGKPGPTPWKLIDTVASYVPGNNLEKIVAIGIKSEIAYIQEGIAIRKTLYDTLNPRSESPKTSEVKL